MIAATIAPSARLLGMIFIVAFVLRFGLHLAYTPPLTSDAREYFINSQTLENTARHFAYDRWYERTPAYMAYLHLTQQSLFIQILLSALTCVLIEVLYRSAGWVYVFYLPSIVFSNMYLKETLLIFLFVLAVYVFRNRKLWLVFVLPVVFSGFISYGGVFEHNAAIAADASRSISDKLYGLWRPEWNYIFFVPEPAEWLTWLLRGGYYLFYGPVMFLFLRHVRLTDFEAWLALGISVVGVFAFGVERYREPVMPFIIGFVVPHAQRALEGLRPLRAVLFKKS
jgi:hypothetical protein